MSGNITTTPGYTFTSSADPITLTKLNLLGTPTAQVDAGAITSRELGSTILLVDPSTQAILYEDFLGDTSANSLIGNTAQTTLVNGAAAAVAVTASTAGRAGLVLFTDTTAGTGYCFIRGAASKGAWIPGSGPITWEWAIYAPSRVSDVTDNYELYVGLANGAATGAEPTDGVYFFYNYATSSGKWVGKTALGSSRTSVVSTTTVAINTWYTLKATINALGTSVEFFINGVSIGTTALTIPAAALTPICGMNTTAGTATSITFMADWVKVIETFTNAR